MADTEAGFRLRGQVRRHLRGLPGGAGRRGTVSIDEMTGIQALERAAPRLPMKSGHVERREFEYVRHGTQALIAAFDVAAGAVYGVVGDTRTEADYVTFLENLLTTAAPTTTWHVVCDNLNTHVSEGVVELVERLSGVTDDLGEKDKSGVLASMKTRAAFCARAAARPAEPANLASGQSSVPQVFTALAAHDHCRLVLQFLFAHQEAILCDAQSHRAGYAYDSLRWRLVGASITDCRDVPPRIEC
jgi:DDE superfamily endonuclease